VGGRWPQERVWRGVGLNTDPPRSLGKKNYFISGSISKQNISRLMVAIILDYKK
jgi:hypothetical protein